MIEKELELIQNFNGIFDDFLEELNKTIFLSVYQY